MSDKMSEQSSVPPSIVFEINAPFLILSTHLLEKMQRVEANRITEAKNLICGKT